MTNDIEIDMLDERDPITRQIMDEYRANDPNQTGVGFCIENHELYGGEVVQSITYRLGDGPYFGSYSDAYGRYRDGAPIMLHSEYLEQFKAWKRYPSRESIPLSRGRWAGDRITSGRLLVTSVFVLTIAMAVVLYAVR